jgi:hypothetical protein
MTGQQELFGSRTETVPNNSYARAKCVHFTPDDAPKEPVSPDQRHFDFGTKPTVLRLPYKDN